MPNFGLEDSLLADHFLKTFFLEIDSSDMLEKSDGETMVFELLEGES